MISGVEHENERLNNAGSSELSTNLIGGISVSNHAPNLPCGVNLGEEIAVDDLTGDFID